MWPVEELPHLVVDRVVGEAVAARPPEQLLGRHSEAAGEGGVHVREPPRPVGREDQLRGILREVPVGVPGGVQGAAALDLVAAVRQGRPDAACRPLRDAERQEGAEDDRSDQLDPRPVEGEERRRQQPGNAGRDLEDESRKPTPAEEDRGGEVEGQEDEREQVAVGPYPGEELRLRDAEQHARRRHGRYDAARLGVGATQDQRGDEDRRLADQREHRVTRGEQPLDEEDGMPAGGEPEPAQDEPR